MLWTAAGRFPPRTTDTAPRTPADARGATPKRPPGPPQPVGFRVPGRLRCVWGFVDSGICASLQKKPTDPRPPPCHPSKTAAGPHASSIRRNCSPEVSSDHHLECSRYVHAEDTASSTRSSRSDSCATSRAPRPPPPGTMLWTAAGRFPPRTTDTAPRTPADARGRPRSHAKRPPGPPQPVGFRVPGRLRCVTGPPLCRALGQRRRPLNAVLLRATRLPTSASHTRRPVQSGEQPRRHRRFHHASPGPGLRPGALRFASGASSIQAYVPPFRRSLRIRGRRPVTRAKQPPVRMLRASAETALRRFPPTTTWNARGMSTPRTPLAPPAALDPIAARRREHHDHHPRGRCSGRLQAGSRRGLQTRPRGRPRTPAEPRRSDLPGPHNRLGFAYQVAFVACARGRPSAAP